MIIGLFNHLPKYQNRAVRYPLMTNIVARMLTLLDQQTGCKWFTKKGNNGWQISRYGFKFDSQLNQGTVSSRVTSRSGNLSGIEGKGK